MPDLDRFTVHIDCPKCRFANPIFYRQSYDRVVDVMEELVKFTLLTRDIAPFLVDRYSERKESAEWLSKRVNQRAI